MRKRISFGLSIKEVERAKKELLQYKKDLEDKCQEFVRRLYEVGVSVARENISEGYKPYIIFGMDTSEAGTGVKAIMYVTNTGLIRSEWRTDNTASGIASADVSPILMAEFGSGLPAENNPDGRRFGMGTGTFPGQTHAEDPEGWWYMDLNYEWHHSFGITPTMPMAHAAGAMLDSVATIAKEVFKT